MDSPTPSIYHIDLMLLIQNMNLVISDQAESHIDGLQVELSFQNVFNFSENLHKFNKYFRVSWRTKLHIIHETVIYNQLFTMFLKIIF
jgi:hypothetical protein